MSKATKSVDFRIEGMIKLLSKPMTVREIAPIVGFSTSKVRIFLKQAIADKRISLVGDRATGRGTYEYLYQEGLHEFKPVVRVLAERKTSSGIKVKVPKSITCPLEAQQYIVRKRHEIQSSRYVPAPDISQFWLIGRVGKNEGVPT